MTHTAILLCSPFFFRFSYFHDTFESEAAVLIFSGLLFSVILFDPALKKKMLSTTM